MSGSRVLLFDNMVLKIEEQPRELARLQAEGLLQWLKGNRPVEDAVFWIWEGGIADRYQDIALGYRSLEHNLSRRYGSTEKTPQRCSAACIYAENTFFPSLMNIGI